MQPNPRKAYAVSACGEGGSDASECYWFVVGLLVRVTLMVLV
jgi:hypothetical protein